MTENCANVLMHLEQSCQCSANIKILLTLYTGCSNKCLSDSIDSIYSNGDTQIHDGKNFTFANFLGSKNVSDTSDFVWCSS